MNQSNLKKHLLAISLLASAFILQGCGSSNGSLSCTATGSLASGSTALANSTVNLTGVTVTESGGTGPFTYTYGGASTTSASTSYPFTGTYQVTTDATGAVVSQATVVDTGNNSASTTCTVVTSGILSTTNTGINLSPVTGTSVALGTTMITASSSTGVANPTFTFTLASGSATVTQLGNNSANVTTTTAQTVTINVLEYSAGIQTATAQEVLYFGTGSLNGTNGIILSPPSGTSVSGTTLVTATSSTGALNPTFTFTLASGSANISQSGNSATVSGAAGTVTINVTEYSSGTQVGTAQETLYFSGTNGINGSGNVVIGTYPSSSVPLGQSITVTATSALGIANATFSFSTNSSGGLVTPYYNSPSSVTFVSSVAATVNVTVTEYAPGSSVAVGTNTITLYFGSGTGIGNGSFTCTVSPSSGSYASNTYIPFTVLASDGEQLQITQVGTTTACQYSPGTNSFSLICSSGYGYGIGETITVTAQSLTSGATCTGTAYITLY